MPRFSKRKRAAIAREKQKKVCRSLTDPLAWTFSNPWGDGMSRVCNDISLESPVREGISDDQSPIPFIIHPEERGSTAGADDDMVLTNSFMQPPMECDMRPIPEEELLVPVFASSSESPGRTRVSSPIPNAHSGCVIYGHLDEWDLSAIEIEECPEPDQQLEKETVNSPMQGSTLNESATITFDAQHSSCVFTNVTGFVDSKAESLLSQRRTLNQQQRKSITLTQSKIRLIEIPPDPKILPHQSSSNDYLNTTMHA